MKVCLLSSILLCLAGSSYAQLPATLDLANPGSDAGRLLTVYGDDNNDRMSSIFQQGSASGDINGDGISDLIIGAPFGDPNGRNSAGEVYIIFGKDDLPGDQIFMATGPDISVAGETRILGDDAEDNFGIRVASGDVNNDGFDDVIVAASQDSFPGRVYAGGVYIIYGYSGIEGQVIDLSSPTADATVAGETRIRGPQAYGYMAAPLACADMNGDGFDDIIACPDLPNFAAFVIYGSSALPGQTIDLYSASGNPVAGETRIHFLPGEGIATLDFNGDGYQDLALGYHGGYTGAYRGQVLILHGGPAFPNQTLNYLGDATTIIGTETRIIGTAAYDTTGYYLAGGDIDGDSMDDLVICARNADPPGLTNAGKVVVVYGKESRPGTVVDLDAAVNDSVNERATVIYGGIAGTGIHGMDCADINRDGYDDLSITVVSAAPFGRANAGRVYLIYGSPDLRSATLELASGAADFILNGKASGDYLAQHTMADLNFDGVPDIINGASFGDIPASTADVGVVHVVFPDAVGTSTPRSLRHPPGATPLLDIGGFRSPVLRSALAFSGGDNGSGEASETTATILRDSTLFTSLDTTSSLSQSAWHFVTNRTGFSTLSLQLQYTDQDVLHLMEDQLGLWRADSLAGPWSQISMTSEPQKRIVRSVASELGYFALRGIRRPIILQFDRLSPALTNAAVVDYQVVLSEPVTGLTPANFSLLTNGVTGAGIASVSGSGDSYVISVDTGTGDGALAIALSEALDTIVNVAGGNPRAHTGPEVAIDKSAPELNPSIQNPTGSTIEVQYQETVQSVGALDPLNYTLSGAGQGDVADHPDSVEALTGNQFRLVWSTGSMVAGLPITVSVQNVNDEAGNPIGSTNTASGTAVPVELDSFLLE